MNVADSDVVRSVLEAEGWSEVELDAVPRLLLVNTCSIRHKAEQKVLARLDEWKARKRSDQKVGVLGCMASRLREELTERGTADLVAGPDAYKRLPMLLEALDAGSPWAVDTQLSVEETYADVAPVRRGNSRVNAFVTIQRGCGNFCSFCIVPFVRGRERSRPLDTILDECRALIARGCKEITLLGQNVNSWAHVDSAALEDPRARSYEPTEGFRRAQRPHDGRGIRFAALLRAVADLSPDVRVRFTSPHPRDWPEDLMEAIRDTPNICSQLHLPLQSGSNRMLAAMRRDHTREAYLQLVDRAKATIPRVTISTDLIAGFCGETEEDHADTLDVMRRCTFDQCFMYAYSQRERTLAARRMADDVPAHVKQRRLQEIVDLFHSTAAEKNRREEVGRLGVVLVEGPARKAAPRPMFTGRTDGNKRVVFPASTPPAVGEYAVIRIQDAGGHSLVGEALPLNASDPGSMTTPFLGQAMAVAAAAAVPP